MSDAVVHIGDKIGAIYKFTLPSGEKKWSLFEGKVKKIVELSGGKRIYSDIFYPIDDAELLDTTEIMRGNPELMFVRELFLLTPKLRERAEAWIERANAETEENADNG